MDRCSCYSVGNISLGCDPSSVCQRGGSERYDEFLTRANNVFPADKPAQQLWDFTRIPHHFTGRCWCRRRVSGQLWVHPSLRRTDRKKSHPLESERWAEHKQEMFHLAAGFRRKCLCCATGAEDVPTLMPACCTLLMPSDICLSQIMAVFIRAADWH